MMAADNGHLSCAQLLLAHGVDTDLQARDGKTALMLAAKHNYVDIICSLLAHDADVQIQDYKGWTALKWAEEENSQEAIIVLKARKEHPDKVTKEILAEARKENCNWSIVKSLIIVHPDINHLNKKGETALRLAWNAENIKLVKLFLDKEARFELQNAKGETSLQIEQFIEKNDVQK